MSNNIVIGIEGYVGAGKTSICKQLLNYIPNSVLLHGGNLYRAIIFTLLSSGKSLQQLQEELKNCNIKEFIDKFNLEIKMENRETNFYVHNKLISEDDLQSNQSSIGVSSISNVADNSQLYAFCRTLIGTLKEKNNLIISGRAILDIYPETDYHFFITASLDERVKRKSIQYNENISDEEIRKTIEERDELHKKTGYYNIYPKSIKIDVTDCKNISESTQRVLEYIKEGDKIPCILMKN